MVLPIFGNNTQQGHWQSDPNGRGTSGILQTCITTLALCVYSSIHLNLPKHKAPKRQKLLRKLQWMLMALLAPELVVFTAWTQRRNAENMVTALRKAYGQKDPEAWYKRLFRNLRLAKSKLSDKEDNPEVRFFLHSRYCAFLSEYNKS